MNLVRFVLQLFRDSVTTLDPRRWVRQLWHSPRLFGDRYTVEDNTQVTVYTDHSEHFQDYQPLIKLSKTSRQRRVSVALVATARNEIATASTLVSSIFNQTRLPDEIVITDTGSNDGTSDLLRELANQSEVPFKVLEVPGANIAQGRNIAIAHARSDVIAVTDFGCKPDLDWLENIVAPFEIDPDNQVSAGRYIYVDEKGCSSPWLLGRTLAQIEPQGYLPPGGSAAFTKDVWRNVGGYPEWLTLTGEDTYFDLELKRSTTRWAFVPEAVVQWEVPQGIWNRWRKAYSWSIGDGEAGMTARAYRWALLKVGSLAMILLGLFSLVILAMFSPWLPLKISAILVISLGLIWALVHLRRRKRKLVDEVLLIGAYTAEVLGYITGLRRRREVDHRRYQSLKGVFFILAGVPIDDTGGGGRWTQIALELLRRQYLIVFVHKFPKYESVDLNIRIRHPNLITSTISSFQWQEFRNYFGQLLKAKPLIALVEMPVDDFQPVISGIRDLNGVVIYDLLDDWETSLGGTWYSMDAERKIIADSQVLIATATGLANRLEQKSNRKVVLLPNAVNSYLFDPDRYYNPPEDLPEADWYIIYIGALWGEWFDWELLVRVARTYPRAAMIVIGDYAGQCASPPSNLHFLGLKPQPALPAYLSYARVAIIPWKNNIITHNTSPLKVYEYLTMRKPVVAPDLQPLRGIPGVYLTPSSDKFIAAIAELQNADVPVDEIDRFSEENDWKARVDALLELVKSPNIISSD